MRAVLLSLPFLFAAQLSSAQSYPFEGTWDCGVAIFSFNAQIFNNGTENLDISDIAAEGDGFILTFADDYQLSVSVNPDGTLSWFSPVSGDSFTCAPVK